MCETPDDWKVIIYKENEHIVAAFPFGYKKGKYGLWHIFNPQFTPRLGIWMSYKDRKRESTREAFENTVVEYIIKNLPYFDELKINFDSRFQNWQQFYRNGFSQTTMYSYIMNKEEDVEAILPSKMRNRIKKSKEFFTVDTNIDINLYWDFFQKSYISRNRTLSYDKTLFFKLHQALAEHGSYRMLRCIDNNTKDTAAVIYLMMDNRRMYNMFGTFDPEKRATQKLTTYEAIQLSHKLRLDFDFEGSMIAGVADFNRDFNAKKESYYMITKYSDKYIFLFSLKNIAKIVKKIIFRS